MYQPGFSTCQRARQPGECDSGVGRQGDGVFAKAEQLHPFEHHATPHSLRHTFAIRYLNKGVKPATVQSLLGHRSVAIILDHYGHAIESTMKGMLDESREARRKIRAEIEA
jgi:integrase